MGYTLMTALRRLSLRISTVFCVAMMCQFLCLFPSCTSTVEAPEIDYGHAYFPLAIGRSWTYEVDSLLFKFTGSMLRRDSIHIQAREVVTDFWLDGQGDSLFIIERYERPDSTQAWTFKKVFSASRTARLAFRTEDNLRLIKLSFPLQRNTTWESTRFIDPSLRITILGETIQMFKGWKSEIVNLDTSFTHDSLNMEDVILVSHADTENLIERRLVREMYAQNVGLVFSQQFILDTQCRACCNGDFTSCGNTPWETKAEKGFLCTQRLIGWE